MLSIRFAFILQYYLLQTCCYITNYYSVFFVPFLSIRDFS